MYHIHIYILSWIKIFVKKIIYRRDEYGIEDRP
jgi:hypothetical protein